MLDENFHPNDISKTFCAEPFEHIATSTTGKYKLCCRSPDTETKVSDMEYEEWFNSEYMQEVRRKMLAGEKVDNCEVCYRVEKLGYPSTRLRMQKRQYHIDTKNPTPLSVDLRPNNVCNLKCATCGPDHSSSHAKEVYGENIFFVDDTSFSPERLHPIADKLRWVYLAGGEPLINPKACELLNSINPLTEVTINTNLSVITKAHIEAFKRLENLTLNMSCDGMDDHFNLLRYPLKFDKFLSNLNLLIKQVPTCNFVITCVLSAFTFDQPIKMLEHFSSLFDNKVRFFIHFEVLSNPTHLDINIIPLKERQRYLEKIQQYCDDPNNKQVLLRSNIKTAAKIYDHPERLKNQINQYIGHCNRLKQKRTDITWPDFYNFKSNFWSKVFKTVKAT
jgi:molybdenum cofactor biosynthesis enzyme MoaA